MLLFFAIVFVLFGFHITRIVLGLTLIAIRATVLIIVVTFAWSLLQ